MVCFLQNRCIDLCSLDTPSLLHGCGFGDPVCSRRFVSLLGKRCGEKSLLWIDFRKRVFPLLIDAIFVLSKKKLSSSSHPLHQDKISVGAPRLSFWDYLGKSPLSPRHSLKLERF